MTKQKIFIIATFLASLFVLLSGVVLSLIIKNRLEERLISFYANQELLLAQDTARIIEERLFNIQNELRAVSKLSEINSVSSTQLCNQKLNEIFPDFRGRVNNLSRTNANGEFVCSIDETLIGSDFRDLDSYINRFFDNPGRSAIVSEVTKPEGFERHILFIHVPVFNDLGEFTGTLGGYIYLDDLQENYLKDIRFAQQGYVFIHDQNGDIIYHTLTQYIGQNFWSDEVQQVSNYDETINSFLRDAAQGNSGVIRYTLQGEAKVAAYTVVSNNINRNWVVVITVPLEEISGILAGINLNQLFATLVISLFLIVLLTFLFLLFFVTRNFFVPLNNITKAAKKIGSGDLDIRLKIKGRDEIATLATAINEMAYKLHGSSEVLLNNIGEGIMATDEHGRIVTINKSASEMLQIPQKKFIGSELTSVLEMESLQGVKIPINERPIFRAVSKGEATRDSYYYIRMDGTKIPVSCTVNPIIYKDTITGAIEVFRDISQEQMLTKAKDEFVSLASHQLRTPLTTISWFTELLLSEKYTQGLTEKHKQHLGRIREATRRMINLVSSLLNVSRLELGTFIVNPQPVYIRNIIDNVIKEIQPQIKKKKLHIEKIFAGNDPLMNLDEVLMHNVIENLLSNAVKYTPLEGYISIETQFDEKQEGILIIVSDTGHGIPANQQDKIFEKFFRATNAKYIDPHGSGLGLYIVKLVVEYIGGKIWFESKENLGSKFFILIPFEGMEEKEGNTTLV